MTLERCAGALAWRAERIPAWIVPPTYHLRAGQPCGKRHARGNSALNRDNKVGKNKEEGVKDAPGPVSTLPSPHSHAPVARSSRGLSILSGFFCSAHIHSTQTLLSPPAPLRGACRVPAEFQLTSSGGGKAKDVCFFF